MVMIAMMTTIMITKLIMIIIKTLILRHRYAGAAYSTHRNSYRLISPNFAVVALYRSDCKAIITYLPNAARSDNEEVDGVYRYNDNRRKSHHYSNAFTPSWVFVVHVDQRFVFHH